MNASHPSLHFDEQRFASEQSEYLLASQPKIRIQFLKCTIITTIVKFKVKKHLLELTIRQIGGLHRNKESNLH